ncbi:uncharacterized protein EM151A_0306 [Enterococcus mundtii]|uniref:GmrSD restriction endonucleases N-terminal domain-containing protein n=1 Tax=Enterococcus mundtii TaxID=53346 RepID=A0AAI8R7A8_ENTMU|nr:DUF262 domain-containing protein [Enterococcus mundtii]BBM13548.1 uncharacterized protein EM151A_0306 [Enterococcus mundtii]
MELNEKFEIKSEAIGELYNKMQRKEIIYDPYYQRKFVWEPKHQVEFIKTILLGLPCPEIFLADGSIDLDTHVRYTHVIDGQQRLRTIERFLKNKFKVEDKFYKDLDNETKTRISTYAIGVVKLKYNPDQQSDEIAEIFRRLNIGTYELTETEKTISKFSDNEFVLLARLISNDITFGQKNNINETDPKKQDNSEEISEEQKEIINNMRENPFITDEFKDWACAQDFFNFADFFLSREIYSSNEIRRNNNSKDAIDMIGILVNNAFHGRVLSDEEIDRLTSDVSKNKNLILAKFHKAMDIFSKLQIPEVNGYKKRKYLYIRSNAFSLFTALLLNYKLLFNISIEKLNANLATFCENLPEEFINAARNSNMDKKQREIRNRHLDSIIKESL